MNSVMNYQRFSSMFHPKIRSPLISSWIISWGECKALRQILSRNAYWNDDFFCFSSRQRSWSGEREQNVTSQFGHGVWTNLAAAIIELYQAKGSTGNQHSWCYGTGRYFILFLASTKKLSTKLWRLIRFDNAELNKHCSRFIHLFLLFCVSILDSEGVSIDFTI